MKKTNIVLGKKILLLPLLLFVGAQFVLLSSPASAAPADDACKDQKSGQPRNACKTGYDGGYANPKTKAAEICDKYNVAANYKACVDGVKAGRAQNNKETAAAGNKVTLANGTNSNITPCGDGKDAVSLRFDLGCQGPYYKGPGGAIGDLLFSIIRFLSYGVGIVVVIAIIVSGIQYTTSEGNAEATQQAKNRIQTSIISLVIYVFIFSIAQFLVPGGLFNT